MAARESRRPGSELWLASASSAGVSRVLYEPSRSRTPITARRVAALGVAESEDALQERGVAGAGAAGRVGVFEGLQAERFDEGGGALSQLRVGLRRADAIERWRAARIVGLEERLAALCGERWAAAGRRRRVSLHARAAVEAVRSAPYGQHRLEASSARQILSGSERGAGGPLQPHGSRDGVALNRAQRLFERGLDALLRPLHERLGQIPPSADRIDPDELRKPLLAVLNFHVAGDEDLRTVVGSGAVELRGVHLGRIGPRHRLESRQPGKGRGRAAARARWADPRCVQRSVRRRVRRCLRLWARWALVWARLWARLARLVGGAGGGAKGALLEVGQQLLPLGR